MSVISSEAHLFYFRSTTPSATTWRPWLSSNLPVSP